MLNKNKNLIIIPLTKSDSWDWSADYIRQTVLTLAKFGYKVIVYLDSSATFLFKKSEGSFPHIKNVTFYYPKYPLPFKRFKTILEFNRSVDFGNLLKKYADGKGVILWTFNPVSQAILKIISKRPNSLSFYDCVDYYGDDDDKNLNRRLHTAEDELIKKADLFFTNSHALQSLHQKKRSSHLVPQGFALDVYKKVIKSEIKLPHDKPLIGFIGSIDARIDLKVVVAIVNKLKNLNFVFWGPIDNKYFDKRPKLRKELDTLLGLPNVIRGQSTRDKIPGLIDQFDVGIIPYDISREFCKYCYPMKLFEYFYLGKPVVTTPIKELTRFPDLVKVCTGSNAWIDAIKLLSKKPLDKKTKSKQRDLAIKNSWDNKVSDILQVVGSKF